MIESDNIKSLLEESKNYVETKIELTKLQASEKLSKSLAEAASHLIISGIALVFLFIFSIFLSMWVGALLNNNWYGFGIVSAFYLLLLITVIVKRDKLLKFPIQNKVIAYLFKSTEDDI